MLKKIREINCCLADATYNSPEDMINKLQLLKCKTKLKFYKNFSSYYDEMNIRRQSGNSQFEEDPFSKIVQRIGIIYREVLLLMKLLHTKPQVKSMNINRYDFYYTVIKNRDDKEIVNDQYEDNENDYINYEDFITLNHYIGFKNNNETLQDRKL